MMAAEQSRPQASWRVARETGADQELRGLTRRAATGWEVSLADAEQQAAGVEPDVFPIDQHGAGRPERNLAIVEPPGRVGQECTNASRSGLIVSACVVGMPCGKPLYVFSVPFCTSSADSGPESA
jgi:hypothetical protein